MSYHMHPSLPGITHKSKSLNIPFEKNAMSNNLCSIRNDSLNAGEFNDPGMFVFVEYHAQPLQETAEAFKISYGSKYK